MNQEVSLDDVDELNLTYYLDDVNDWKASQIDLSLDNLHDEREWVSDRDFFEIDSPFRKYQAFQNRDSNGDWNGIPSHDYQSDLDDDPSVAGNIHSTISQTGAITMRIHFSTIDIEDDYDALYIYDGNNKLRYTYTGYNTSFYTPWIYADELKITINSDSTVEEYGYDIDYYEFYNSSTGNYYNYTNNWGFVNGTTRFNYGLGNISSTMAMYVALVGDSYRSGTTIAASYDAGDFTEVYQNITIPRENIIDTYISFDYYAEEAMASNENFIYVEINNKRIYSKGLRDVAEAGRETWYNTGNINMDLWVNSSNLFDLDNDKDINISIGIMSGATIGYSGFEDRFQQVFWFDNLSLVLTTLCNATQNDINLTINSINMNDGSSWGEGDLQLNGQWDTNPITLTFNTSSPSLTFDLDMSIYAFHNATSKINQQNDNGASYKILDNGTIYWEFLHNFYMPSQYTDFEFIIQKPMNWKFISVLDPTFNPKSFEGGAVTSISEEISGKNLKTKDLTDSNQENGFERVIELDFKHFFCLIVDKEDVRIVFITKEKASDRLKNQVRELTLEIYLEINELLKNWDGGLDQFEELIPPIIIEFFELYYKETFKINKDKISLLKMKKELDLSKMETRVINVIRSTSKKSEEFNLEFILQLVSEENKDLVIEAIESLIKQKLIIPFNL